MPTPPARITLDPILCIGATACTLATPTLFTLDQDGRCQLKQVQVRVDAELRRAVAACPSGALKLSPS